MEAYKKTGRGGAGNYYSKKDIEDAKTVTDLEAQTSAATPKPIVPSNPPPEYLHSGRGGAGNWVKPADLQSQGLEQNTAENNPTSTAPTAAKKAIGQSKPAYRGGRGGAGNYIDPAGDERRAREEAERKQREMEARIEKDIEAGLTKPGKTYDGHAGAFEMQ